jgi:hypothetical protein
MPQRLRHQRPPLDGHPDRTQVSIRSAANSHVPTTVVGILAVACRASVSRPPSISTASPPHARCSRSRHRFLPNRPRLRGAQSVSRSVRGPVLDPRVRRRRRATPKQLFATKYLGMTDRVMVHGFDTFTGLPEWTDPARATARRAERVGGGRGFEPRCARAFAGGGFCRNSNENLCANGAGQTGIGGRANCRWL